jgi:hypothetical protein
LLDLPQIAEEDHRLRQMKRRAVVQANPLAEIGKPNSVPMARHFLEDCEGTSDRLNSAACRLACVLVDTAPRMFHKTGDWRCVPGRPPQSNAGFGSTSQKKLPISPA